MQKDVIPLCGVEAWVLGKSKVLFFLLELHIFIPFVHVYFKIRPMLSSF